MRHQGCIVLNLVRHLGRLMWVLLGRAAAAATLEGVLLLLAVYGVPPTVALLRIMLEPAGFEAHGDELPHVRPLPVLAH